jgi:pimeloyl-ACP methyl ester carboxylesterase
MKSVVREKVRFESRGESCVGWHYPGTNGACLVMAGGFAVTKEPGTDRFAHRFAEAGFSVVAFDYRHLGESDGTPRQVVRLREQLQDWRAALGFAAELPEVDPSRIAVWGFSVSGGHVVELAAADPRVAAAIAQTPNVDGPAATRNAARFTTPKALLGLTWLGLVDAVGGVLGRPPRLVPLVGEPGSVALLSTPDALADTTAALDPEGRYSDWLPAVAARSTLAVGFHRSSRRAPDVRCPLLVVVADNDRTALAEPAAAMTCVTPNGELVRVPGGHYAPFLDQHEQVVAAEVEFLRRHLVS